MVFSRWRQVICGGLQQGEWQTILNWPSESSPSGGSISAFCFGEKKEKTIWWGRRTESHTPHPRWPAAACDRLLTHAAIPMRFSVDARV